MATYWRGIGPQTPQLTPRKQATRHGGEFETDDPIGKLERQLKAAGKLGDEEFRTMQREVREQVREAVAWNDASPVPAMDELYHDVFVEPWGPYTGSSDPSMLGSVVRAPGVRTIDTDKELA